MADSKKIPPSNEPVIATTAEEARLAALHRYEILDTPPEEDFDDLARLAAQICDVPIALVSLVDRDRLWFKAKVGVDGTEMPRENSFCAHAVAGEKLIVPDAREDPRFCNHPVVTGPAQFRFYAGVCLVSPDGHKLGTLCVLDQKRRELTPEQLEGLSALARQVMAQLELRRTLANLWGEMDLARKIQTVLLPAQPKVEGYELAAVMRPAAVVGGDYYDVFRAGDDDWALIGDVSGHGVTSGLVMMMVQAAVRATVQTLKHQQGANLSPSHVLSMVNAAIISNLAMIGKDQYMTISALKLQGSRIAYAGLHQDILVYRAATKSVERIETEGVWLGLLDDINGLLQDHSFEVAPGDIVLLYTDGFTEARSGGKLLATEGLAEIFLTLANERNSAREILDGLMERFSDTAFADDATAITLRRT